MMFSNRIAVITGASRGIGRAIAIEFARLGATVVVNFRESREAAENLLQDLHNQGATCIAVQADVSKNCEAIRLIDTAVAEFGGVDILVNNAAWTSRVHHNNLDGLSEDILDRTIATNLKGPLYCCRAAIPQMLPRGSGAILNITSMAGITGNGSSIIYCATKAGLSTMTRSFARAFAPTIRVNSIAPGFVDTGFAVPVATKSSERALGRVHIGQLIRPEDVALVATMLCSPQSVLTGEEIVVDGGIVRLGIKEHR